MSELIAVACATAADAFQKREGILRLDPGLLDEVGDAVIARVDANGVIDLDQMVNLWSVAPKGTMLWGFLAGLLFLQPLLGVLDASLADQISQSLAELGVLDGFVDRLRDLLAPGHAMMFLCLANRAPPQLLTALGAGDDFVLQQPINEAKMPLVRDAFDRACEAARKQRETAYSRGYVAPPRSRGA